MTSRAVDYMLNSILYKLHEFCIHYTKLLVLKIEEYLVLYILKLTIYQKTSPSDF